MFTVTVTLTSTGRGWSRTFGDRGSAFTYANQMRCLIGATVKVAFA